LTSTRFSLIDDDDDAHTTGSLVGFIYGEQGTATAGVIAASYDGNENYAGFVGFGGRDDFAQTQLLNATGSIGAGRGVRQVTGPPASKINIAFILPDARAALTAANRAGTGFLTQIGQYVPSLSNGWSAGQDILTAGTNLTRTTAITGGPDITFTQATVWENASVLETPTTDARVYLFSRSGQADTLAAVASQYTKVLADHDLILRARIPIQACISPRGLPISAIPIRAISP